jgi:hypothetical protein
MIHSDIILVLDPMVEFDRNNASQHVAGDVFDGYNTPLAALVDVEGVYSDVMIDSGVQGYQFVLGMKKPSF